MEQTITKKLLLSLSLPLTVLLAFTGAAGLWNSDIYAAATPNWTLQTIGQDGVDLFLIVPVLLVSTILVLNKSRLALSVWAGTNIYIVYTFVIYCLDVKFNPLFLFYCFILGLASFSTAAFFYKTIRDPETIQVASSVRKVIGYFFIGVSVLFYFAWLSDVLPAAFAGRIPDGITETGLITNPVHVLDLSIILPLVFVTGVLTLKGRSFWLALTTPLLTFFVLMDITIAALSLILYREGMDESYSVSVIMGVHAVISVALITLATKKMNVVNTAKVWNFNSARS